MAAAAAASVASERKTPSVPDPKTILASWAEKAKIILASHFDGKRAIGIDIPPRRVKNMPVNISELHRYIPGCKHIGFVETERTHGHCVQNSIDLFTDGKISYYIVWSLLVNLKAVHDDIRTRSSARSARSNGASQFIITADMEGKIKSGRLYANLKDLPADIIAGLPK